MDRQEIEAGVEIGDFRLERRLGAGGMGIVYQARQVSLGRVVALKVLGAALGREADRMRFQREAQAVAKLSHPAIAGVHFIGQDRHVCYMAMEFIDGPALREVIDRLAATGDPALTIDLAARDSRPDADEGPEVRFDQPTIPHQGGAGGPHDGEPALPGGLTPLAERLIAARTYLERCCRLAIEAAKALAHAHERGVVHRDVKPENILIDRTGHVHLIDFGVARFFEDNTLTNTGALVGTPMYMSPEQVTGRIDIDHRTDIYSLGLVVYELLTLSRPITSPTREGLLRQIVTKTLPPVSWRNPAIPRDLEGVLHKATAKDPDDRYQSAGDLADDLERWLDGKPVIALPYRHRLDPREIKAERPGGIIVLAFAQFLAASVAGIVALYCTLMLVLLHDPTLRALVKSPSAASLADPSLSYYFEVFLGTSLLVGAYLVWAGFGLLAANRWARWSSVGVSALLVAWFLYQLFQSLLPRPHPVALAIDAVGFSLCGAMLGYLLRRQTCDWFRLAARLRTEHGRRRPSLALGEGKVG